MKTATMILSTIKLILAMSIVLLVTISTQAQDIINVARAGNLEKVKELIEKDPQLINVKDTNGRTPLHWACRGVHLEVLKYLVEKGADINVKNNSGDTPLHYAVLSGNANIVKQLLDHGAQVSARNNSLDTPLSMAVVTRNKELMEILLERGAEYVGSGIKALNLLQTSARNGFEKMFKIIVNKEGNSLFSDKEKYQWTMQDAVSGGSIEIVNILLENKIPLNKKGDVYGWTPIHYAVSNGNLAMIEFLVSKGVSINERTKAGETAYNLAELRGNKEAQSLIVKLGGKTEPQKFPIIKGPYLGQKAPGMTPQIFAPGIVSRPDLKEISSTFSTDGKEIYFYGYSRNSSSRIFESRVINNTWTAPKEFSFTSEYSASEPFISLDNQKLFFIWDNPLSQSGPAYWVSDRVVNGWSKPTYAGLGMFLSQSKDGQMYTTDMSSINVDGILYIAKVFIQDNKFSQFERLVFPYASGSTAHPTIAPDGSYIMFDQGGGDHIQISFKKKDGSWGEPIDLTKHGFEPLAGMPTISPDGKYLFFKQGCRGQLDVAHGDTNRDIWWVDIKILEKLRPKE